MSDPIADLLTRIKNAKAVNKNTVIVPYSKFKESVVKVIQEEGYIASFGLKTIENHKYLILDIKDSKITHIRRISKPGQRNYVSKKFIPKPLRGMGLIIMSTPIGVISGKEAVKKNTGGELICEVW